MKSLSDAKMLGGIGSILLLVGAPIPQIGLVVAMVGLILQFIAVKHISEHVNEKSIFSNYLINFIFGILAFASLIIIMITTIGSLGGLAYFTSLEGLDAANPGEILSYLSPLLSGCLIAIVVVWILSILGAIYLRKSYDDIAKRTKVESFKTTGFLYLLGTATIIIVIGIFIIFIARIFEIISYFNLPDSVAANNGENIEIPNQ